MNWNPIGSRKSAVAWIFVWKILDVFSTQQLVPLSSTQELSPFVNILAPILGFETVLMITIGIAVGFAYVFYYSIPVVVEVLAVYLPIAVTGNFSVYIHPLLNNIIVLTGITSFILYLVYYELTHRINDYSATETRFLQTASA